MESRPCALIGVVVCPLCAAPRVQLFAIAGTGWPHNALTVSFANSSCQLAATSETVGAAMQCYNKYPDLDLLPLTTASALECLIIVRVIVFLFAATVERGPPILRRDISSSITSSPENFNYS